MKKHFLSFIAGLFVLVIASCGKSDTAEPSTAGTGTVEPTPTNPTNSGITDPVFSKEVTGSAFAACVDDNKNIFVLGYFGPQYQTKFKIYKLTPNGAIDKSFDIDKDKTWSDNLPSRISMIALPQGKILISGSFKVDGVSKFLIRLNADGSIDKSYTPTTRITSVNTLVKLTGGRIAVLGRNTFANGFGEAHFFSLNELGEYDRNNGFRIQDDNTVLLDLIESKSGKIYLSGFFRLSAGKSTTYSIARFNPADLTIDESFAQVQDYRSLGQNAIELNGSIIKMVEQSDGKIIIGGSFDKFYIPNTRDNITNYHQVARLNTDGSIDATFKNNNNYTSDLSALVGTSSDQLLLGRHLSLTASQGERYLELLDKNGNISPTFKLGMEGTSIAGIVRQDNNNFIVFGAFGYDNNPALYRVKL
ncbi:delta-60 repeat domain-containing protein [Mucilaginibacter sp. PAMB04274]|uniref:delta-60 repeat domain-containing protein n=1 Tax=Mucilaginibacter sp. PAMB04274 TaxID=3138568 RepID=UPI0031F668B2